MAAPTTELTPSWPGRVPARPAPAEELRRRSLQLPAFVAVTLGAAALVGAAAALSPVVVAAIALALLLAIRTLARPHLATLAVVALLYSNAVVVAVRWHGLPEAAQYLVPLALAVPMADRFLRRREPMVLARSAAFAALFLVAQIASTLASRDPGRASEGLEVSALEGIALFLLLVNSIPSASVLRKAGWVVLLVGAALGGLAVVDALTGYGNDFGGFAQAGTDPRPLDFTRDPLQPKGTPRVGGSIGETNRFAQVLLMAVGLGVAFAGQERRPSLRWAGAGLAAAAAAGVVLTFSRGGAVALVIILLIAVGLGALRPRHVAAGLLAIALVLVSVPEYRDRLTSITQLRTATQQTANEDESDGSIRSRATENLAALNVFLDHPILGVGPELFPTYYGEYATRIGIRVKPGEREAHNLYLDVASELGTVGLLSLGGVVVATIGGLRRARRSSDPELRAVATGLLLGLAGYLISGVFLHFSFVRYFWLLMGLAGAASVLHRVETPRRTPHRRVADGADTLDRLTNAGGGAGLRAPSDATGERASPPRAPEARLGV